MVYFFSTLTNVCFRLLKLTNGLQNYSQVLSVNIYYTGQNRSQALQKRQVLLWGPYTKIFLPMLRSPDIDP